MNAIDLHRKLITICEKIATGDYEQAKAVFELSPCDGASDANVLVEAFAMMLVRIEAREFELSRLLAELQGTRAELLRHKARLANENRRLRVELRRKSSGERPLGQSTGMRPLLQQAERAALVDATLLLTGETGTGKGLFAKHIHALSRRSGKPFIAVNCAAIPSTLLESELFGIEAGVASGVAARMGRFEQASGGTILLDEIGDMPIESQTKLLHVLETGLVERVGGRTPINVDVRIMAATHRNLESCVKEGTFRADLYYRLNVVRLHIPPLRERREDIPLLVHFFLTRLAERSPLAVTAISSEAMAQLTAYDWPGNVRELENELERAALLAEGDNIAPGDLSAVVGESSVAGPLPHCTVPHEGNQEAIPSLRAVEEAHIRTVLHLFKGNKSRAARALGISREGLRVRLDKMQHLPTAL